MSLIHATPKPNPTLHWNLAQHDFPHLNRKPYTFYFAFLKLHDTLSVKLLKPKRKLRMTLTSYLLLTDEGDQYVVLSWTGGRKDISGQCSITSRDIKLLNSLRWKVCIEVQPIINLRPIDTDDWLPQLSWEIKWQPQNRLRVHVPVVCMH